MHFHKDQAGPGALTFWCQAGAFWMVTVHGPGLHYEIEESLRAGSESALHSSPGTPRVQGAWDVLNGSK